jgi:glycosyltransferase involved in cell wall biosynthesis
MPIPQDTPLISVVMPVYNAEKYVGAAIESILAQTHSHFELILVDDGSTDESAAIARQFAERDGRIRVLCGAHAGQSDALNVGVGAAAGEYIALFNNDDIALPERLAAQLDWMRQSGVDVCGSCVKLIGARSRILWFPERHETIRHELLLRSALLQPAVMAKAHVFKDNSHAPGALFCDYEMWLRLASRYRLGNLQRVLVRYRKHPDQVSCLKRDSVRGEQREYQRRYFHELFPEASDDDRDVVARLAFKERLPTLDELSRAGSWLVRLTDKEDLYHRNRMAERWMVACRQSAQLGMPCFRLYNQRIGEFEAGKTEGAGKLWLQCAARIGSGSPAMDSLKRLLRKGRAPHHAAPA